VGLPNTLKLQSRGSEVAVVCARRQRQSSARKVFLNDDASSFSIQLLSPIRSIRPLHLLILHSTTSPILGPNVLLRKLFSNTLRLCFSLRVKHQILHPYGTTGKIIVLYILIFTYLYSRREERDWIVEALPEFDLLLSFPNTWTVRLFDTLCHDSEMHSGRETPTYTQFALRLLPDQPPY
jgi:hypothetical protein